MLVNVSTLSWDAGEDEGEGEDEDEDEGDKIALANFNTAMRLICDCYSIAILTSKKIGGKANNEEKALPP